MKKIEIAKSVMDYFPLERARDSQEKVIEAIEKAYQNGARVVILEAPVGSGKSAIAITHARRYGQSHILTPKKGLQDQYYEDFNEFIHLMKGRSSYPCVWWDSTDYSEIVRQIQQGATPSPAVTGVSTAEGRCKNGNFFIYEKCNKRHECPYSVAINYALTNDHVVHNIHSFIFQAYMHQRFDKRGIIILDECHNLEGIVREFLTRELRLRGTGYTVPEHQYIEDYEEFLKQDSALPRKVEEREQYIQAVDNLLATKMKDFVVTWEEDSFFKNTTIRWIPKRVGLMPNNLLFNFGEKVLLMSGTIYDKSSFCRSLGIREEDTVFIRVPSTFPVKNRPIVMKQQYMTDNSHKSWSDNFDQMISNIEKVMERFPNVKGLIHAPSYKSMDEIFFALSEKNGERCMVHTRENFKEKLEEFYASAEPKVFISPICQEGVDFKGDRARFQMILRVPYPNAGDKLTATLMKEDYPWYNRQALIVFGQQIGRINRSEDDHGVTVLMDSRFVQFVNRNRKFIPPWLTEAIVSD